MSALLNWFHCFSNDDYSQTDDLTTQGALYSVSHHLPNVSTSFPSICPTDAGYGTDQMSYSSMPVEWEKNQIVSISESNCVKDEKIVDSKFLETILWYLLF